MDKRLIKFVLNQHAKVLKSLYSVNINISDYIENTKLMYLLQFYCPEGSRQVIDISEFISDFYEEYGKLKIDNVVWQNVSTEILDNTIKYFKG